MVEVVLYRCSQPLGLLVRMQRFATSFAVAAVTCNFGACRLRKVETDDRVEASPSPTQAFSDAGRQLTRAMWSKGTERKVELVDPVGVLYRGRRRYELGGQSPRFCYPMAVSGGDNLPKIPPVAYPASISPWPSPRQRSSQAYGSFYFSTHFNSPTDANGPSSFLQSEAKKSSMLMEMDSARRWRGGPRYEEPAWQSSANLPPLATARSRSPESVGVSPSPLSAR